VIINDAVVNLYFRKVQADCCGQSVLA